MKVCVLDQEGDQLSAFTVSNDLPGAQVLKEWLLELLADTEIDILKIGLESTPIVKESQYMALQQLTRSRYHLIKA